MVVLGAGGLLGRHVVAELGAGARAIDRATCDITNQAQVIDAARGARLIVNCAAFTDVDGAERDEARAHEINAVGAEIVARAAREHGAKLVHISTDFVFDGAQAEPYDEQATPRPLSAYARTKLAGEERVRAVGGALFLVRVQGLYGAGGRNFSSKLRDLLLLRKTLKLDCERRVQPTWARAAARQIAVLARSERFGIYHVSCRGETTWAGFTRVLAERLGLAPTWQEVPTAALAAPAARPPNCTFAHRRLAEEGFQPMPDWQSALDEYLKEQIAA
jgi:dTDP-4-dehydrorhamnose reductase